MEYVEMSFALGGCDAGSQSLGSSDLSVDIAARDCTGGNLLRATMGRTARRNMEGIIYVP
jgi:2-methylaconitate cis-trans-isomerase PrpF